MSDQKGFSIWSLMLIMTLLAVWLAVPRHSECFDIDVDNNSLLLFCLHQVFLWSTIAALVWLLTKRRVILAVEIAILLIVWGPLLAALFEDQVLGAYNHPWVAALLWNLGVREEYNALMLYIYEQLGYGPQ